MLDATHKGLAAEVPVPLIGDGKLNPWAGNLLLGAHPKHRLVGKLPGESVAQHHMKVRSGGRGRRAGGRRKKIQEVNFSFSNIYSSRYSFLALEGGL